MTGFVHLSGLHASIRSGVGQMPCASKNQLELKKRNRVVRANPA